MPDQRPRALASPRVVDDSAGATSCGQDSSVGARICAMITLVIDEPAGAGSRAGETPDARDEALVAAIRAVDPDVPTVIFMRHGAPTSEAASWAPRPRP